MGYRSATPQTALDKFLQRKRIDTEPSTVQRYYNSIVPFVRFCEERGIRDLREVGSADMMEFQEWRISNPVRHGGHVKKGKPRFPSKITCNNELKQIRTFLDFCLTMEWIEENPAKKVKLLNVRGAEGDRRALSREEVDRLIRASLDIEEELLVRKRPGNKVHGRRGQTDIWRFLVNTGLRISELIHLRWSDYEQDRGRFGMIHIQEQDDWKPKTYARQVHLNQKAREVIDRIVTTRKGVTDRHIFRDFYGDQLVRKNVLNWFRECLRRAGLDTSLTIHHLRHTFITHGLKYEKIELTTMKEIVGHKSIHTTMLYCHYDEDCAEEAMAKFSGMG